MQAMSSLTSPSEALGFCDMDWTAEELGFPQAAHSYILVHLLVLVIHTTYNACTGSPEKTPA